MAKPIRSTPVLRGEDARRFIRQVLKEQRNPSFRRLAFLKQADKTYEYFKQFL